MVNMNELVDDLRQRKERLRRGGDKRIQDKLHEQGMLTARERLDKLLDPGSFVELDMFVTHHCTVFGMDKVEAQCDGIITGYGTIDGKAVFVYSQDFSVLGGTLGRWGARKLIKMMDLAYGRRAPIIGLNHSSGARFHELARGDLGSGFGFGEQFYRIALYSGIIPQISLMMGDNAAGGVYGPGMSDFIIATKKTNMFISGPVVVKAQVGESLTPEELGGARMHASVSGVVHVLAEDDEDCINKGKELLSFLPPNNREKPPVVKTGDDRGRLCPRLNDIVPTNPKKIYDMHKVIEEIVDNGNFFEIHRDYCKNMIIGFARFDGHSVGIVSTNPAVYAGTITEASARKGARFIRFCDLFNIPLIYLVDSPAYLIGSQQERAGVISRGTALIFATAEAIVPKITVDIRKSGAASSLAMGSLTLRGDVTFAWVTADLSTLTAQNFAEVIYAREIRKAANPEEIIKSRTAECEKDRGDIYDAASWQNVNDIIEPAETRIAIIRGLDMTKNKVQEPPKKRYSNIPL